MRILLLNDYGTESGGAELQMLEIRRQLRARGHEVRLMTSDARLVDDFDVLADRTCAGRTDIGQVITQTINPSAWRGLRRELVEHPPDVVHIRMFLWQLSPLVLLPLARFPTLFQAAVFKAVCPTGLKMLPDGTRCNFRAGAVCRREGCVTSATWASTMTQLASLRRWRHHIDQTVALSRRMRDVFEADGWSDVGVLGNGIHLRPTTRPLPAAPTVGYAGRLAPEKGVETLIDAFSASSPDDVDARLLIAGTGPDEAALRARAAPLGDRVRFLGHLDRSALEAQFASLRVQVVPSLWEEPFGNVTTEAMARGTAVIASDVGGQSDLVRESLTGHLVPPGDVAALTARLRPLLADRAVAERLGDAGRVVASQEYSWDAVTDRLLDVYDTTISSHRDRHATGTR